MKVYCFALFACAFNLLVGYAGLLAFGHAAFFGAASYVSAFALKSWGWPMEVAIIASVISSAALGLVFGAIAIRRTGIYFAMITLALSQIIYFMAVQLPFTQGEDGIHGVPRPPLLGFINVSSDEQLYYFVLAVFVFGFLAIYRIVHSPFGHTMRSIRDNETRAISLGYDTQHYKLGVFVLSAAIAGLAGGTKAAVVQLASLTDVHFQMSGEVILMVIVGGVGTLWGPVIGAALIVAMHDYLASIGEWMIVIQGLLFLAVVQFFRRGIMGELLALLSRIGLRKGTDKNEATTGETLA
ncbi:MAG: branched-chain amino acid ABC transporter permease [Rhizobiaceae bacterium]|nr:branched-chain amino acid ABC transporter permease [Rhizobiaceae bacterium]